MTDRAAYEIEPVSSFTTPGGKTAYRYEIEADSLRDALDEIPGDFLVYWTRQDKRRFAIEVIRSF